MGDVGLMGMHVPGMSWREMREAAVLAEELGYSCLTMGESWGEDALTSLAQLAAATSRVRIGTSIVPVFARSPANLAMTALNMDRMTGGRFFLGLGTSGRLVIEDFHGENFAKPLTRMREYIDIIRKAARGERLDHDGERPHIAFYIGGMGVFYHQYMHRIGFGADADRVREAFQARQRDRAAELVTDEMVDAMTILGTPKQCHDQIQRFFDAGVQEVRLVFNEPNKDAYLKALRAVAPRG